ncbi:hypothetical protein BU17DRAFT_89487 [Hysterangium stoloniferum]|nr:hypothetical protein BU17DRAFT_89487 [Hysterangium stoloniferum]
MSISTDTTQVPENHNGTHFSFGPSDFLSSSSIILSPSLGYFSPSAPSPYNNNSSPESWDDFFSTLGVTSHGKIRDMENRRLAREEEAAKSEHDYEGDLSYCQVFGDNTPICSSIQHCLHTQGRRHQGPRPLAHEIMEPSSWTSELVSPANIVHHYPKIGQFIDDETERSSPSHWSEDLKYIEVPSTDTGQFEFSFNPNSYATIPAVTHTQVFSTSNVSASPHDIQQSNELRFTRPQKRSRNKCQSMSEGEDQPRQYKPPHLCVNFNHGEMYRNNLADDESGGLVVDQPRASGSSRLNPRSARQMGPCTQCKPASAKELTKKRNKNRAKGYKRGLCDCLKCVTCSMTCFYVFPHGSRKGQTCRRIFESGRIADKERHETSHAVQEWIWVESGVISLEEARWYDDMNAHAFMCPYGECKAVFTRHDAVSRHMYTTCCYKEARGELEARIRAENNMPTPDYLPILNLKEDEGDEERNGNRKRKGKEDERSPDELQLKSHLRHASYIKCKRVLRERCGKAHSYSSESNFV